MTYHKTKTYRSALAGFMLITLPKIRAFLHILGLAYPLIEILTNPLTLLRMTVASICFAVPSKKLRSWGGAQWWAVNMVTAAISYGTKYRTVSGIAAERAPLYPRYRIFRDFIDRCSYVGHCDDELEFELKYSMDAYKASKDRK